MLCILPTPALCPPPSMNHRRRSFWIRQWSARPRLLIAFAVGLLTALLLPQAWAHSAVTRALLSWNAGVVLYLVLVGMMVMRADQSYMRLRARLEDEGRWVALLLVSTGVVVSLLAIALQLGVAKEFAGLARIGHMALAAFTVLTSWAFMQTMFALHYAHEFYGERRPGGLDFPGAEEPDYVDFFYVACVIGTSGQTADVAFSSRAMRRIGMLHCMLAFFFNTTVLALTINIAASLI